MRITLARAIGVAMIVAAWSACARPAPPRPRNLVIVTLDTTRADRLPMYGFASIETPAIDRLAREGVVFDQAMSVAPLTLTAHSSLFTGLYPPHHGVRDNADRPLPAGKTTMAEILRGRGFRTGAFVGSTVLAADRGLSRGFDVYDDGASAGGKAPRRRPGNEVVDGALRWLDSSHNAPFFLWVHLYDAHTPQTLPDAFRRQYAGDLYAGGIAFADSQLGRLVDRLRQDGRLDSTAVIVAGDHGESLGEHGESEHGIFLYEGTLHIPMIVRAPGLPARRVSGLASLVDVLPTAIDLLGLAPLAADGMDLVPALRGRGALPERSIYAESMYARRFGWSPLRALRDGRFKLVDAPRPELYDLETDPFEEHDLSAARPGLVNAMRAALAGFDADSGRSDDAAPSPVAPDIRARLASLGYTSGAAALAPGQGSDPKDHIEEYNALRRGGMR
ncbi:MAG TPA: sulfatase [Vicinamibacterales bacterium]|nr:sulfatase [Vicinamibacterales bacterium]